jgi:cytochrome c oxidase subunit 2
MAPMARTLATEQALEDVVAYLSTLPDNPAEETVIGDADRGRRIFSTCAACHGAAGQGIWSTNAPRLAGMSDWYLVRQLANFRDRIRGGHAEDIYGQQMHMMAVDFKDEQTINDIVAYINTLP